MQNLQEYLLSICYILGYKSNYNNDYKVFIIDNVVNIYGNKLISNIFELF